MEFDIFVVYLTIQCPMVWLNVLFALSKTMKAGKNDGLTLNHRLSNFF